MTREKARMINGELYLASDPELVADRERAHAACHRYSATHGCTPEKLNQLAPIFGALGGNCYIEPPFFCDYGFNLHLEDGVYINTSCCILDCAAVHIGRQAKLGPNVQIYTAAHPLDPEVRRGGLEFAKPIRIGANAWIGGHCVLLPGVTIGENAVIGAGSIVTRDVPANVVAAGNPCRILRALPV